MRYLKTNTATRITVGPFLDKTDGITPEVALTATNEHLTLVVDTGEVPTLVLDATATASGGNNDMVHITGDDAGFYDLELTAAQLNYLGRAMLSINYVTDHLPVFHEFMIVRADIYDSMFGTDYQQVDVIQVDSAALGTHAAGMIPADARDILGTAISTPASAGILDINVKNIANAAVNTATAQIGANVVTQANIDFGALQKASLNAATPASVVGAVGSVTGAVGSVTGNVGGNVVGSVASVTGNVGGNVVGSVASVTGAVGSVTGAVGSVTAGVTVTTNNDKTGYGLSAAAVQAIWDALLTSLTTVGSIGKKLADWVVGTIDTYTGNTKQTADHTANIAAIKTKTDLIGTSVALETGGILADIHNTDLPAVKADTAAILADTGTDGVVVAAASKTGYALAQGALGIAHITLIDRIYEMINNKMSVHDSTGVVTLLSIGGASTIATGSVNDDLTDTVRLELTW